MKEKLAPMRQTIKIVRQKHHRQFDAIKLGINNQICIITKLNKDYTYVVIFSSNVNDFIEI